MSPLNSAPLPAPAGATNAVACFAISADAEPGVLSRVIELAAKRGCVPERLHAARHPEADGPGELSLDLHLDGFDVGTIAHLAQSFRQIVGVRTVLTSMKASVPTRAAATSHLSAKLA